MTIIRDKFRRKLDKTMGQKPADIPKDVLQKLYFEEKLTQKEIAKQIGCSQQAVQRRMKKHNFAARNKVEIAFDNQAHNSVRRDFDGTIYEKAHMLGFCKGDVHPWVRDRNSQTIRLMTATTKPEQIELFQNLFSRYGHVYVSKPDTRGAIHMGAYVNLSLSFLLDREDDIPNWVLHDEETFFAFLAGYSDAEAHIGVHNGYAVFKIDSYDKNIIHKSYLMLQKADIIGPIPWMIAAKGSRPESSIYRNDMWRLQVSAKASLLMLFERIAPYLKHAKRIRDMEAATANIHERNNRKRLKKANGE